MSTYLIINLLIVIVPLLFSFENKISFYKKIPSYLFSVAIVSTGFVIWDSFAVSRGDWGFNDEQILGIKYLNLPIEELFFFLTVPYSCLFIYETVSHYVSNKQFTVNKILFVSIVIGLLLIAFLFRDQYYTFTVLIFTSSFILISLLFFPKLLQAKVYWITIAITFIPFFIFNFILTYIPVVVYSQDSIWGLKFITIPIEDFFYSYSMISFWILFYSLKERKINFSLNFKNR